MADARGRMGAWYPLEIFLSEVERRFNLPEGDPRRITAGDFKRMLDLMDRKVDIDLAADPCVPDGWRIVEHRRDEVFTWDPHYVELHLEDGQRPPHSMTGHELHEALKSELVLNATAADWLLAHPENIPLSWTGLEIYFWGTVYECSFGRCVRCIRQVGGCWDGGFLALDCRWFDGRPAAIRKT